MGLIGGIAQTLMSGRQAKSQRAWSKRRYAERYQVTMADMKKAGLNPILAAAGAGIGGGSAPSGAAASAADMSPNLDAVTSASKVSKEQDERKVIKEEINVKTTAAELNREGARLAGTKADAAELEAFVKQEALRALKEAANSAGKTKDWLDENERIRTNRQNRQKSKAAHSRGKGVSPSAYK